MKKLSLFGKGFTMVELLVVISIVSVLLSFGLVYTADAKRKGQDGLIVSETYQVKSALDLYASQHDGGYPNPEPKGKPNIWCVGGDYCTFYSNGVQTDVTQKLQDLPITDFNLPRVNAAGGVNRGILYQQCVSLDDYCPSATDADIADPADSTSARILSSTWKDGSSLSFVGTWSNTEPDIIPPPTTVDLTMSYIGKTYGLGTKNDSYDKTTVPRSKSYTISWTSNNATSCTLSTNMTNGNLHTIAIVPFSGSGTTLYNSLQTYTYSCIGLYSSDTDSITMI